MSECVVQMEMPQDCWFCPNGHPDWIYNDDGAEQMACFCNICNTEEDDKWISEIETERPSWCPIICQLPEGHGRLVDADTIIEVMKKCAANPENAQALLCYRYAQRILEEAPTVEPVSPWHRVEDDPPDEKKEKE